jgi:hypothetical protein
LQFPARGLRKGWSCDLEIETSWILKMIFIVAS